MTINEAKAILRSHEHVLARTNWLALALERDANRGRIEPEDAKRGIDLLEEIEMMYMGAVVAAQEALEAEGTWTRSRG